MTTIATNLLWIAFGQLVLLGLWFDLRYFGRDQEISERKALSQTVLWVALAVLFGLLLGYFVLLTQGVQAAGLVASQFFTGYLLEKSLAIDNLFVFYLLFEKFRCNESTQRRILNYGIMGALILRALFIVGGLWIINQFHWILVLFGVFLLYSGCRMWCSTPSDSAPGGRLTELIGRILPYRPEDTSERLTVRHNNKIYVTPLFVLLASVMLCDVVFAVDSIPAVFAVSQDPFIVVSSNVLAVLGLRSLYFLLAKVLHRFEFLGKALSLTLVFIGFKLAASPFLKIPPLLSMGIVISVVTGGVLFSLWTSKQELDRPEQSLAKGLQ